MQQKTNDELNIHIDEQPFLKMKSVRYLRTCVHVDCHMRCGHHVQYLVKKSRYLLLFIFNKLSHEL